MLPWRRASWPSGSCDRPFPQRYYRERAARRRDDRHDRAGIGVLATIYFDRVMWLAHEAGTDSRVLLGRAIAHELGHLLLATTTHGPVGLMRAHWSQGRHDDVRRGDRRDPQRAERALERADLGAACRKNRAAGRA